MKNHFYTELAKYYDKIYHYVDYNEQVDFFLKLIDKFADSRNKKILDLACGTGKHANLLHKKGFEVTGIDISDDMIQEARNKYPEIGFEKGDMKTWAGKDKFSAIVIFFNSILYNNSKIDLLKTLKNCYSQLEENGLLIFDTVDKTIGIDYKPSRISYSERNLKIKFSPQWVYKPNSSYLNLKIKFLVNGKRIHDQCLMGAFTLNEQKLRAKEVGFEVTVLKRSFKEIKRVGSKDKKAIFVCQR